MTTLKEEEPYAAAVDSEQLPFTCSKCFAWNLPNLERMKLSCCTGCNVLHYCGRKCQKKDWKDHKSECKVFQSAGFVPSKDARLVMRMIEKSRSQPGFTSFNGRTYESLMHHSSERRQNRNCMTEARTIYAEIERFMGSEAPDFHTVFLALSKKAINAFKILDGTWACVPRGIGIYLGLSVLNHSCRPDAFVVNQGSKMMLRTTEEDWKYSDELTISYDSGIFAMDTNVRLDKLENSYFFFCQCEECEDVESNKKKTSGRSVCCPNSWFSIPEGFCNNCNQEVSSELAAKAGDAMVRLRNAASLFLKLDGSALPISEWMELFDSCKEVLSDENVLLFRIAHIICISTPLADFALSCKYADFCAPVVRENPHCVFSVILLCCRLTYYETLKKPLQEKKEALNEALNAVQVVFGPKHELTQTLLEQKALYDIESLNTPSLLDL